MYDRTGKSASKRARVLAASLLLALFLSVMADTAYAQVFDKKIDGGYYVGTVGGYGYTTYGREQALAEFLGYDWDSFSSTTQAAILGDSNGDNAFKSALEQTKNVMYETLYDETAGMSAFQWPVINVYSTLFGLDHMWDIKVTKANYEMAQKVIKQYAFPSSGGSGGGSDLTGFPFTTSLTKSAYGSEVHKTNYWFWISGEKVYGYDVEKVTCTISKSVDIPDGDYDIYSYIRTGNSPTAGALGYCYIYIVPKASCEYVTLEDGRLALLTKESIQCITGTSTHIDLTYISGTENLVVSANIKKVGTTSINAGVYIFEEDTHGQTWYFSGLEDSSEPYKPMPDPEPQDPVQPSLPDSPGKQPDTTLYDPNNTTTTQQPDTTTPYADHYYNWYINNQYTYVTEPGGTDVTSYLLRIWQELEAIHTDFDEWFATLNQNVFEQHKALADIYNRLGSIGKSIETTVKEQTKWLHDELQTFFNNTGKAINRQILQLDRNIDVYIDDAVYGLDQYLHGQILYVADVLRDRSRALSDDITYWLKMIYFQLGGGVDLPMVTDDDIWGTVADWVHDSYDGVDGSIVRQESTSALGRLLAKFPFSVPSDIIRLLTYFEGEAVTPVITFTVPVLQHDNNITLDLTAYDDAMTAIRQFELLAYTIYCLWLTPRLLELLDVTKDL